MILLKGRSGGRRGLDTRGDRGATAVEYGIMVSLIALVIVAGVTLFGRNVSSLFVYITNSRPFG